MNLKKTIIVILLFLLIAAEAGFSYWQITHPGKNIWDAYRNFATPSVVIVRLEPGMRKEEVADRFAKLLNWTPAERQYFLDAHERETSTEEGYFFPDNYVISIDGSPDEANRKIIDNFNQRILNNPRLDKNIINLDTAIKIASIIQREAGSKSDMKIISAVIWNRIFQGMPLQMDATIQYVKGTSTRWWPRVLSSDLKIDSPYNTYLYKGFPPTAISSPSEDAIWAALNPPKSDILFYIHDENGRIHTARSYQEHLANIDTYY